jgi:cobaltochelatase CobN
MAGRLLPELPKTVELVAQVKSTAEYDMGELDHYYEFLGGLRSAIELPAGKRVETVWVDTTGEVERVRSVEEAVDLGPARGCSTLSG